MAQNNFQKIKTDFGDSSEEDDATEVLGQVQGYLQLAAETLRTQKAEDKKKAAESYARQEQQQREEIASGQHGIGMKVSQAFSEAVDRVLEKIKQ